MGDDISKNCKHWRHYSCILEMTSLGSFMVSLPHLFANKFMPEYDFGASVCWHQFIFNKTYLNRNLSRLEPSFYKKLPQVTQKFFILFLNIFRFVFKNLRKLAI